MNRHLAVWAGWLLPVACLAQTLPAPPVSPRPVVTYEYDANGNPTRTVQAPGVAGFNFQTVNSYDNLNRVQRTTDARSKPTVFGYNGREDVTQVTDPRNLITQSPRNGLGDVTSLVSPDTGTATHTYDAAGNLTSRTDSRGVLFSNTYDVLNRLVRTTYTKTGMAAQAANWNYDETGTGFSYGIGRLTSTSTYDGRTQYAYDPQGRVVSDTQTVNALSGTNAWFSKTVSYGYNASGQLTSLTYPSGRRLSFTYTDGLLSAIGLAPNGTASPVPLVNQIQFDPSGALTRWVTPMSASVPAALQANERIYDTSGRLVRYRLGPLVRDITYDAANRITGYTHYNAATAAAQPAFNQSFSYDELGRLTQFVTASETRSFSYDDNGNRTSSTSGGTTTPYTVSTTSNRLNAVGSSRSFGYDAMGNTTSDSANYTASYDTSGRLASLTKAGVTTRYTYDALGRRTRKAVGTNTAGTTLFVYDSQGQLLGEYDSNGNAIREYVWLQNTPLAVFQPAGSNPPTVYYVHTDHLNTPRVVVDTANNLRWRWMAEPFGTTAAETSPAALAAFTLNLRFPGQYFDQESGLHYNYFRDYDSGLGRYVQSDPIGLDGGINTFSYVDNNPLLAVDPNGQAAMGARIGGYVGGIGGRYVGGLIGAASPIPGGAVIGGVGGGYLGRGAGAALGSAIEDWIAPSNPAAEAPASKPAYPDVCPEDFCEQLALAEAKAGAGKTIMGAMGDEPRLVAHYGPGPWVKRQHEHVCSNGRRLIIHYFSNGRGMNVELKFK